MRFSICRKHSLTVNISPLTAAAVWRCLLPKTTSIVHSQLEHRSSGEKSPQPTDGRGKEGNPVVESNHITAEDHLIDYF